jgi:hypothetical protein
MITIFRSDSAIVVMKGRARDVGIGFDFLFESQSELRNIRCKQFARLAPHPTPPYEYGDSSSPGVGASRIRYEGTKVLVCQVLRTAQMFSESSMATQAAQ